MSIDFGAGNVSDGEVRRDRRFGTFLAVRDVFQESVSFHSEALDGMSQRVILESDEVASYFACDRRRTSALYV